MENKGITGRDVSVLRDIVYSFKDGGVYRVASEILRENQPERLKKELERRSTEVLESWGKLERDLMQCGVISESGEINPADYLNEAQTRMYIKVCQEIERVERDVVLY